MTEPLDALITRETAEDDAHNLPESSSGSRNARAYLAILDAVLQDKCRRCDGMGQISPATHYRCDDCDGTGLSPLARRVKAQLAEDK